MSVETLEELLMDGLKDLYSARKANCAGTPKTGEGRDHLRAQRSLTEPSARDRGPGRTPRRDCRTSGQEADGEDLAGMKGVLEEGSEVLEDIDKGIVRDAALISASQRVEHHEMRRIRRGTRLREDLGYVGGRFTVGANA